MYTLRFRPYDTKSQKFLNSVYVKSLSTDRDTAIVKAINFVDEKGANLDLNFNIELEQIQRNAKRTAEEIEAEREAAIKIQVEKEEKEKQRKVEKLGKIVENQCFVAGKYNGKTFDFVFENDIDYIVFMYKNNYGATSELIRHLVDNCGYKLPETNKHLIGEVGEDVTFTGKVVSKRKVSTYYGISTITIIHTNDGAYVKTFSNVKFDEGEICTITGKVKEHIESDMFFNDNSVTLIGGRLKFK